MLQTSVPASTYRTNDWVALGGGHHSLGLNIKHTLESRAEVQAKFQSCCKTLTAYCRNVYTNLEDDSKRKINCSNRAFQERVAALPGGVEFLNQVGFQARIASHAVPSAVPIAFVYNRIGAETGPKTPQGPQCQL